MDSTSGAPQIRITQFEGESPEIEVQASTDQPSHKFTVFRNASEAGKEYRTVSIVPKGSSVEQAYYVSKKCFDQMQIPDEAKEIVIAGSYGLSKGASEEAKPTLQITFAEYHILGRDGFPLEIDSVDPQVSEGAVGISKRPKNRQSLNTIKKKISKGLLNSSKTDKATSKASAQSDAHRSIQKQLADEVLAKGSEIRKSKFSNQGSPTLPLEQKSAKGVPKPGSSSEPSRPPPALPTNTLQELAKQASEEAPNPASSTPPPRPPRKIEKTETWKLTSDSDKPTSSPLKAGLHRRPPRPKRRPAKPTRPWPGSSLQQPEAIKEWNRLIEGANDTKEGGLNTQQFEGFQENFVKVFGDKSSTDTEVESLINKAAASHENYKKNNLRSR